MKHMKDTEEKNSYQRVTVRNSVSQPGAQKPRSKAIWDAARMTVAKHGGWSTLLPLSCWNLAYPALSLNVMPLVIAFNETPNINWHNSKTMWLSIWIAAESNLPHQKVHAKALCNSHKPLLMTSLNTAFAHLPPRFIFNANAAFGHKGFILLYYIFLSYKETKVNVW